MPCPHSLSSLLVPSTGPGGPQLGCGNEDWSLRQGHLQAVSPEDEEFSRWGLCPSGSLLTLPSLPHFLQAAESQLSADHAPWAQDCRVQVTPDLATTSLVL